MKLTIFALALLTTAAHAASVPACSSNQISLSVDGENGNFAGMSHNGALLILRNIGPSACSVPAFPALAFHYHANAKLPITRDNPASRFMHPGPVVLPAILAAGAEVTATLRWVSGDVYDHGSCVTAATLSITVAGVELTTPLDATICGESQTKISYTITRLQPDPVYTPKL